MNDSPQSPSSPSPAFDLVVALKQVVQGLDLSRADARAAVQTFVSGDASPVLTGALLAALTTKGIAPSEIAGGVEALRGEMIPVDGGVSEDLVDTAGTGGGAVTTFNISTAAALVAAGAGVRMAKHGNRSFTSRSGSADVLEALGVRIDLTPEQMGDVLREVGIVFMFAPLLHPAMRHVGPVRRELGIGTLMNLLGPLTNPAGAHRQVVGVSQPELRPLVVAALAELGHAHALVVHGEAGMDEISPTGPTRVSELFEGTVRDYVVTPEDLGLESRPLDEIAGAEPDDNARIVQDVLEGRDQSGARTVVLLNAAAAIRVSGRASSLSDAVEQAAQSVDEGRAATALDRLREATNRV
jgi:anthranilate phosphoribosyltransferase